MNIEIEPGKYVVAVSGGVDSVVLLNLLKDTQSLKLVVAHFDHGIRPSSREDCDLVAKLSEEYGLEFFSEEGKLGPEVSEALARTKRYEFLRKIKDVAGAKAIITAHHQDDVIETAILNLLRGSGRRGLSSLRSTGDIKRPLLDISKQQILDYAAQNNLQWREDETNLDLRYFRNYIRQKITAKLSQAQRDELLAIIKQAAKLNDEIDKELNRLLATRPAPDQLNRQFFIMLPHVVSKELLAAWLRQSQISDISAPMLERLVVQAKILAAGQKASVDKCYSLEVERDILALRESKC